LIRVNGNGKGETFSNGWIKVWSGPCLKGRNLDGLAGIEWHAEAWSCKAADTPPLRMSKSAVGDKEKWDSTRKHVW